MSWAAVLAKEAAEPGFAAVLRAWALQRVGTPFQWGQMDCALLACEAVDVQTSGLGLVERYRGRYASMLGAMRYQLREGVDLASVLRASGLREIPAAEAVLGDIVCVPDGAFQCGHVVMGPRSVGIWPDAPVGWCWTESVVGQVGAVGYTLRPTVR